MYYALHKTDNYCLNFYCTVDSLLIDRTNGNIGSRFTLKSTEWPWLCCLGLELY